MVLPGALDMHVHFRTPGGEHKETLQTGAAAAVKGGVTTVGDMPNTNPRTTTIAALEGKMARAEGASANLFFHFGAEPDNLAEVARAVKYPQVVGLKIYMGPSTGQGGLSPEATEKHFKQAADLGLPVMVHAEDVEQIEADADRFPHDVYHHGKLRSLEAEWNAIDQALTWAKKYPLKLYLTHVTSEKVLEKVERSGISDRVMVEVCPHHLVLATEEITQPVENRFRVNPPLRDAVVRDQLLTRLGNGIDVLGSDHAPHTLEEKEAPYDKAPSGMPGVEYILPFALSWWNAGAISTEKLLALTSGNAARFFGLSKGALEIGMDGDLVLVDPKATWKIGEGGDNITSKCGWTPYQGRAITGRPEVTVVGGKVVYQFQP